MKRYLTLKAQVTTVGAAPSEHAAYIELKDGRWWFGIDGWWGGWGANYLDTVVDCERLIIFGNYGKPVVAENMSALIAEAATAVAACDANNLKE